jgi:TolB-like protein/DNA-binding winged helix-turn-helix (wHTH) protein/tetratricopeptide (TPR) repeat protein
MASPGSPEIVRFRDFTLDLRSFQLLRLGRRVRLERRPMDLLILLLERRPGLVTHEEIADRLWGRDVFVDVETGIHGAVRKVRQALRDSPDRPAFIETVPARGYRFVAPVQVVTGPPATAPNELGTAGGASDAATAETGTSSTTSVVTEEAAPVRVVRGARFRRVWFSAVAFVAVIGLLTGYWFVRGDTNSRVTLVVLPFEILSGDVERNYLAEGLAEELVVALDKIDPQRVSVIGRSSLIGYQRTAKPPADVGRELGADYLVDSSIRAESTRLRITVKLIRVRDQVQVWSDSYDREPARLLDLQRELSGAIADKISVRLSAERLAVLGRRQTHNPEAYDLYLRGRDFANQRTPPTTAMALEYFERAVALDPDYALAWSALAMAHAASPMNSDAAPGAVWPRARAAAIEAVRIAPDLAEAQFAFGYVTWMFDWDWAAAERAFRQAIDRDPRYAQAHLSLGHLLSQMGRHAEAVPAVGRARELEPLFAMAFAMSSQVSFQAHDQVAALDHARQAIVLSGEFWVGYMVLGQAYEQLGQYQPALDALTTAARFSGDNSKPVSLRGYTLAKAGRARDARDVLDMLAAISRQRYVPPYAFALVHAGLDERDAVFAWLERAYAARDVHLMFLTVDPKWDPYRADPRFIDLLARCGFAREPRPDSARR